MEKKYIHSFRIVEEMNLTNSEETLRVVALWGDFYKKEGMRIGKDFPYDQSKECNDWIDNLISKLGPMPIELSSLMGELTSIYIGDRVKSSEGIGIVSEISHPPFPFLIELQNGGTAWVNEKDIIRL